MNNFRDKIKEIGALRFVMEQMELCSSPGRMALLETSWASSVEEVERRLEEVARYYSYLEDEHQRKGLEEVTLQLEELMNVAGSIEITRDRRGCCSDVDLFELKRLALIESKVRKIADRFNLQLEEKPNLEAVLEILDPDGERLPAFFISDSYSAHLADLRKQMQAAKEETEKDQLAEECAQEEDKVRRRLTRELSEHADEMSRTLAALAKDDVTLAKAKWARQYHCCRPQPLASGESKLRELIHPEVKSVLAAQGLAFQPVSLTFRDQPTLITGANMAGKSVLLSSIALAQALMQYGFYVNAEEASLVVVDDIMISMGDDQDIQKGLSSFGAEMLRLNGMVKAVKNNTKILALIDEPARTTNPTEGTAIVNALVALFANHGVRAIITTHYSGIEAPAKRLRVKGFVEEHLKLPLEVSQLNRYIDYTLEEDTSMVAPQEAIRIAEILGMDQELLQLCRQSLRTKNEEK